MLMFGVVDVSVWGGGHVMLFVLFSHEYEPFHVYSSLVWMRLEITLVSLSSLFCFYMVDFDVMWFLMVPST